MPAITGLEETAVARPKAQDRATERKTQIRKRYTLKETCKYS